MALISQSLIDNLDVNSPADVQELIDLFTNALHNLEDTDGDGNVLDANKIDVKSIFTITMQNPIALGSKTFDDPVLKLKLPEHLPPIELFGVSFFAGGTSADTTFQLHVNDVAITEPLTAAGNNALVSAPPFNFFVVQNDIIEVKIEEVATPDYVIVTLFCRAELPRLPVI